MTNIEKARAIVRLFEEGRDGDAWNAMDFMLRNRPWPDWLHEVCDSVDALTKGETHG